MKKSILLTICLSILTVGLVSFAQSSRMIAQNHDKGPVHGPGLNKGPAQPPVENVSPNFNMQTVVDSVITVQVPAKVMIVAAGNAAFGDGVQSHRASICPASDQQIVGGRCDCPAPGGMAKGSLTVFQGKPAWYCECKQAAPLGQPVAFANCLSGSR